MASRELVEFFGRSRGHIISETPTAFNISLFDGAEMWCPKSDTSVTPCLVRDFYWESWITSWFLKEVEDKDNFVDIGANSGYYSAIAAHHGLKTYAFEPNGTYTSLLELIPGITKVYPLALSDSPGKSLLRIPSSLEGSATLRTDFRLEAYDVTNLEVEVSTLDAALPELEGKTLVKIDVEGMEEHVMRGATKLDAVWVIEYTPEAYSGDFLNSLLEKYTLAFIDSQANENPITPEEIKLYGDWLMLVLRSR